MKLEATASLPQWKECNRVHSARRDTMTRSRTHLRNFIRDLSTRLCLITEEAE